MIVSSPGWAAGAARLRPLPPAFEFDGNDPAFEELPRDDERPPEAASAVDAPRESRP